MQLQLLEGTHNAQYFVGNVFVEHLTFGKEWKEEPKKCEERKHALLYHSRVFEFEGGMDMDMDMDTGIGRGGRRRICTVHSTVSG